MSQQWGDHPIFIECGNVLMLPRRSTRHRFRARIWWWIKYLTGVLATGALVFWLILFVLIAAATG